MPDNDPITMEDPEPQPPTSISFGEAEYNGRKFHGTGQGCNGHADDRAELTYLRDWKAWAQRDKQRYLLRDLKSARTRVAKKKAVAISAGETMGLIEGAQFLRVHEDTLSALARQGEVPGCKVGRRWVFQRTDLVEYLRVRSAPQPHRSRYESESLGQRLRALRTARERDLGGAAALNARLDEKLRVQKQRLAKLASKKKS
jgi:excisionase family DNA binding protein